MSIPSLAAPAGAYVWRRKPTILVYSFASRAGGGLRLAKETKNSCFFLRRVAALSNSSGEGTQQFLFIPSLPAPAGAYVWRRKPTILVYSFASRAGGGLRLAKESKNSCFFLRCVATLSSSSGEGNQQFLFIPSLAAPAGAYVWRRNPRIPVFSFAAWLPCPVHLAKETKNTCLFLR